MDREPAHDPDPDEPLSHEASRLIARYGRAVANLSALQDLPPTDDEMKKDSRARDAALFRGEMEEVYQALSHLNYTSPDDRPIARLSGIADPPLLPGPPPWYGAEADENIEAAANNALAAMVAGKPRPLQTRVTAMRVFDHYLARGERMPEFAKRLLAGAMWIDGRSVTALQRRAAILRADEAGRRKNAVAGDLNVSDRTVRARRNSPPKDKAALFAAVSEGTDLRALRPVVADELDLLDDKGRWWGGRVIRELTSMPERAEPILVGGWNNGRAYAPQDELPVIVGGDEAALRASEELDLAWRNRSTSSCGGILELDQFKEAIRVEAQRRWDGQGENDANKVARALRTDPRKVRRWMERSDWEGAVQSHRKWLRRKEEEGFRAATVIEARRRLRHEGKPQILAKISNDADAIAQARAAATGRPFPVATAQVWMGRPAWEPAVEKQMDRLREEKEQTELRFLQRGIPTPTSS